VLGAVQKIVTRYFSAEDDERHLPHAVVVDPHVSAVSSSETST
jgi:hypothetical protein